MVININRQQTILHGKISHSSTCMHINYNCTCTEDVNIILMISTCILSLYYSNEDKLKSCYIKLISSELTACLGQKQLSLASESSQ